MLPSVQVNYVSILAAAIASVVIGALWFGIFAKVWLELIGRKEEYVRKNSTPGYVVAAISTLVTAFVLAHFVHYTNANTFQEGAVTGFWLWLGFVATSKAVEYSFEGRSNKLLLINVGHHLVEFLVMGAILAIWK